MVFLKIKIGDEEVKLPPIMVGETSSMTDYSTPETEILIIKSRTDCGELYVSKSRFSVEQGKVRVVGSDNLQLEKKFDEQYSRNITTKFGKAVLFLTHVDINRN